MSLKIVFVAGCHSQPPAAELLGAAVPTTAFITRALLAAHCAPYRSLPGPGGPAARREHGAQWERLPARPVPSQPPPRALSARSPRPFPTSGGIT